MRHELERNISVLVFDLEGGHTELREGRFPEERRGAMGFIEALCTEEMAGGLKGVLGRGEEGRDRLQ